MRTENLLAQSQRLTVELQSQQGELKKTNDRLEQQAASLQISEDLLKNQQEELRKTNEELEDKAQLLLSQKKQVEVENQENRARQGRARGKGGAARPHLQIQIGIPRRLSHELRTPLNSLLVLSKLLSDNADNNLSDKQVQFSETIQVAGRELALINDILDLSKIKSGTVTLDINAVRFSEIVEQMERTFPQVARSRSMNLRSNAVRDCPRRCIRIQRDCSRYYVTFCRMHSNSPSGVRCAW